MQPDVNGGWLSVLSCEEARNQLWSYDEETRLVHHVEGKCLDASQRNTNGGLIHLWTCDETNPNQIWDYDEESQQMKNRHGICLDGPEPDSVGSRVHMWACDTENRNQHWSFEEQSSTPSTTTDADSITTTAATTTLTETPTTTATTTSKAKMLTAFRNCHLEPLVDGAGCKLVEAMTHRRYHLNKHGQETTGRAKCLRRLRSAQAKGVEADTFVHSLGRCELWFCKSLTRLRNSAGQGGGAAAIPNGISLRSHLGTYVAAEMDGSMHANGEEFTPASQFQLVPGRGDGKMALIAQNGLYVKAEPGGHMSATADVLDDWEEFEVVNSSDGLVALKSWHNLYVVAEANGALLANRPELDAWEEFRLSRNNADEAEDDTEPIQRERPAVFSNMCDYQPGLGGLHGKQVRSPVFVKLWEWNYPDVARECEDYLSPNGFDAVQVSPVIEHIKGYQWWTKYQPVSQGLNSRSGTEEEFVDMVARCRAVGVEVIVDMLLNHMASPCKAATEDLQMPCEGWAGSKFGKRTFNGSRGWDRVEPEMFHHTPDNVMKGICSVGPHTGWLCPDDDCTPCDMYGMPDFDTSLPQVRRMHVKHLEELYGIGVTMLRLDAAIYHTVDDLASMLNKIPWDLIYQEWWGEYPPEDRTEYVGHYRDVNYRWQVVNRMANKDVEDFPELLTLRGGVHGINEDMAVYPFAYHDGRSAKADPETATYKNGLEFHQQQKFFLGWPHGIAVIVWGGYGWQDQDQGPPGCDNKDSGEMCRAEDVFDASGEPRCLATPTQSPLPEPEASKRGWICEHRWQGVAGMINFRKACRGLPLAETWHSNETMGVTTGRLAYKLASEDDTEACFVALVRGYNEASKPQWGHLGDWQLKGLHVGLPAGKYCDLASLETQRGWDGQSCPREVVIGESGTVQEGLVLEGDLLAIHTGAMSAILS